MRVCCCRRLGWQHMSSDQPNHKTSSTQTFYLLNVVCFQTFLLEQSGSNTSHSRFALWKLTFSPASAACSAACLTLLDAEYSIRTRCARSVFAYWFSCCLILCSQASKFHIRWSSPTVERLSVTKTSWVQFPTLPYIFVHKFFLFSSQWKLE